ncbi:uncharacterized protein LOC122446612 [Cervus canadensis]|uniref:uncharacterized protein LOC122446612 n=1 Tax=Cervus canadensis TaxID=1574408 RepID=UPI001C9E6A10|nr:uncharacterized protein LOC122446612 [Cervus canadensis]
MPPAVRGPGPYRGPGGKAVGGGSQPRLGVAVAGLRARGTRPRRAGSRFLSGSGAPGRLPAAPGQPLTAPEPRAQLCPASLDLCGDQRPLTFISRRWEGGGQAGWRRLAAVLISFVILCRGTTCTRAGPGPHPQVDGWS